MILWPGKSGLLGGLRIATYRDNTLIPAAIFDVKLGDWDSLDVCQALFHRRVPFLFHTGHAEADLVKAWPEVPVLVKPAWAYEIVERIIDLVH